MIAIIDYGAGNLRSVHKAFAYLGLPAYIAGGPADLTRAARIVLPGVGAFGAAVARLQAAELWQPLQQWLQAGKPVLGICLGMQLLFETSAESPGVAGFGLWPGTVRRMVAAKVPHIGWNQIHGWTEEPMLTGVAEGTPFYFVHSYVAQPVEAEIVAARTEYGGGFPALLRQGAVAGVQFHPEKSGPAGLQVLKNWVTACC